MYRYLTHSVALLLLLASMAVTAQQDDAFELFPARAEYKASIVYKGIPISGRGVRELKQVDGEWVYSFEVKSFVLSISEQTRLDWVDNQVVPKTYEYKLKGWAPSRHRRVEFDWQNGTAKDEIERNPWELTIEPGTLDNLGYQLQLWIDMIRGKTAVTYPIAHKGRVKDSVFEIVGEEVIDTEFGEVATVVVKKIREPDSKRETTLWAAKDWKMLLVRMEQVEKNGTKYTINLAEAELPGLSLRPDN